MDHPILQYVATKGSVTAKELLANLDLPERTLFRDLERLVNEGQLIKIGSRPNVLYMLPSSAPSAEKPAPTSVIASEQSERSNPTQIASSPSAPRNDTIPPPDPKTVPDTMRYPELLLYWCKFLRLDPKAVTESYHQIRPLIPNYQSIGMSPPKSKQLGLKMPDPIWVKFFNLLTWIMAILWTILKNCWTVFRTFYKGEIPWGPIALIAIAAWIVFALIVPMFVQPKEHSSEKVVAENPSKMLNLELQRLSRELDDTQGQLSRSEDDVRDLKGQLEAGRQAPSLMQDLKKKISILESDLRATKSELETSQAMNRSVEKNLQRVEQDRNTRGEELQRTREEYDQRLSDAKTKIRILQKELIQSESQTSSLKYDLEKEQARTAKLKEEMEVLRRSAESK